MDDSRRWKLSGLARVPTREETLAGVAATALGLAGLALPLLAVPTLGHAAPGAPAKCQAVKLLESGKLGLCVAKAQARAAKKGTLPDLSKCEQHFARKWQRAEQKSAGACSTEEDERAIAGLVRRDADRTDDLLARGPDPLDNVVEIELSGILQEPVVMVSGPGVDFERVRGFTATGRPRDVPGNLSYRPVIFEYSGASEQALESFLAGSLDPLVQDRRSASLMVRDALGAEVLRWNLYELALTGITMGRSGRKRYRLEHLPIFPSSSLLVERTGGFLAEDSFNPATDKAVEISGILTGRYPAVQVDPVARTITFTFDYVEGGGVWGWVVGQAGAASFPRDLSIIDEVGGIETGRTNYFGAYPHAYEVLTGFGLAAKLKERLVVGFDSSEAL